MSRRRGHLIVVEAQRALRRAAESRREVSQHHKRMVVLAMGCGMALVIWIAAHLELCAR